MTDSVPPDQDAGATADRAASLSATRALLRQMGLPTGVENLRITGREQRTVARRRISTAATAALAATGAATVEYWRRIGGAADQTVTVDMGRATQALYVAAHTRRADGWRPTGGYGSMQVIEAMNPYLRTRDDRWIDLVMGSARPSQIDVVLKVLGCDLGSVARAVRGRDGLELEAAIHAQGATAGLVRTAQEWRCTAQGAHMMQLPVVRVERIGDAPPRRRTAAMSPNFDGVLRGVRVLDATHVIAGPMVARTLAEQGADVLHVTRPVNHDTEMFLLDLGVGKRNTVLDLDDVAERSKFATLAETSDVFIQSYRPGALAARGFSPEALAEANPGVVVAHVSCFGESGPDGGRRGVDPVAQAVSGLAMDEADHRGHPSMNPMVTLTDPLVGYLGAAGVMAALARQAEEGGSWLVRVSLTGSAMWLQDLGWSEGGLVSGQSLALDDLVTPDTVTIASEHFSEITYLAPVVRYSETPGAWRRPPEPATAGRPEWLATSRP